ncbi:MAG: fumarylacetoacetate hydrolase family protein [Streptosporangiaceae bacterium]|jgi:2-keto-4-pentenoate hydratase
MTYDMQVVARLRAAARDHIPCPPVRDVLPEGDIAAAYAVQRLLTQARLADGATVVGRKIGLTAPVVQAQMGVNQPDFGVLFDDMDVSGDAEVATGRLLQPRIEAEVAFWLAADLDSDDLSPESVRAAVGHVVGALEIVDSRIADWDITICDTVADNASSGLFVLSDRAFKLDDVEPVSVTMRMLRDDVVVSEGSGDACLGDPLNALLWLATTARDYGDPLRAGQVVLSGALGPMVAVHPGDHFTAEFSTLGTVSAAFSKEDQ